MFEWLLPICCISVPVTGDMPIHLSKTWIPSGSHIANHPVNARWISKLSHPLANMHTLSLPVSGRWHTVRTRQNLSAKEVVQHFSKLSFAIR